MNIPLNLGVRAHDLCPESLSDLLQKINRYGFPNIQFAIKKCFPQSISDFQALSNGTASYYEMQFAQEQIKISVLSCYVNIVSRVRKERIQAIADFKAHIRLAREFGANMVGTETGSVGEGYTKENYTEEAFYSTVLSVREMVSEAEKFGVTVGIEAGINHPLHSVDKVTRLLEEVSSNNLQIIFDCVNLLTIENYKRQDEIIEDALSKIGNRIAVIHLKDFIIAEGKIKIVPVGKGLLNVKKILLYVKYQRPHLQVILEEIDISDIREAKDYVVDLYDKI